MREIIFRGKTLLGEWFYGDLIHGCEPRFAYIVERGNKELCRNYIEVIPGTVGQFVGLRDKNGKEIFEGDVIRLLCHEECKDVLAEVRFFRSAWRYFTNVDTQGVMTELAWEVAVVNGEYGKQLCDVIGNIHDDFTLLKEVSP